MAATSGLKFRHESGHSRRHFIPEVICGGVALFDMDNDGGLDAYLVQSGRLVSSGDEPKNQLFRNRGDGTFEDVSAGSGAVDAGYGVGVTTGDYDNDGDVDLYVTNVGPNVLYRNDGRGHFRDVTAEAGVGDRGFGTSAAFVDYDSDGDLDLVVLNYLVWSVETEIDCTNEVGTPTYCSPSTYERPAQDTLYENRGDGTFRAVTVEAGWGSFFGPGLGVVCGDFTGDGQVDIFVANDGTRDQLWVNQGSGKFADQALYHGCAVDQEGIPKAGMGVAAEDIDDDGDLDLIVSNITGESDSLFLNHGEFFEDRTAGAGLSAASRPFTRFGIGWVDFDHDGLLDLYEANGKVAHVPGAAPGDPLAEPNLLFRGLPGGRFEGVRPRGGVAPELMATSRGAAFGDVDGDGDVDILIANRDGSPHLLRNIATKRGHWIRFDVRNRRDAPALGATLTARLGDRRLLRYVRTAYGYCAANDPRIHMGLGSHQSVGDVTVRWTEGRVENFGSFEADRAVVLREGEGTAQ